MHPQPAPLHKYYSVGIANPGTLHAWALSRDPATCNKNGQTRTGHALRTPVNHAVNGHGLPLVHGGHDE